MPVKPVQHEAVGVVVAELLIEARDDQTEDAAEDHLSDHDSEADADEKRDNLISAPQQKTGRLIGMDRNVNRL